MFTSLSLDPILSQINPVTPYVLGSMYYLLLTHMHLCLTRGNLFHLGAVATTFMLYMLSYGTLLT